MDKVSPLFRFTSTETGLIPDLKLSTFGEIYSSICKVPKKMKRTWVYVKVRVCVHTLHTHIHTRMHIRTLLNENLNAKIKDYIHEEQLVKNFKIRPGGGGLHL